MHFHPGPGAFAQRDGKLSANFSGPIDIRFESYRLLSATDGIEHPRKDFIAVLQSFDPVAT